MAMQGFSVEVPRLPGHGTHWRDLARTEYSDWRAAAGVAAKRLRQRCDCIVLVGQSMGGTLVLDLAADRPSRVAGCVAINAQVLDRKGIAAKLAPLIAKLTPLFPAVAAGLSPNNTVARNFNEHAYSWLPTAPTLSLLSALPKLRAKLRQVNVPLLVAYGRQDSSVPPHNSLALPKMVGSSEVTILELPESAHLATVDNDHFLLEQRITDFIIRCSETSRDLLPG